MATAPRSLKVGIVFLRFGSCAEGTWTITPKLMRSSILVDHSAVKTNA
jgi:hypothetical protein